MKKGISTALCVLAAVVLAVAAVGLGAVRGWTGERDSAMNAMSGNGALRTQLEERAMDAANLQVVAARHLSREDAMLKRLQSDRTALQNAEKSGWDTLVTADADLTALAAELGEALPALDSVKASQRDQVYISTLTRTLAEATDLSQAYASAVTDYNERLTSSLTGKLAMLLGVQTLGTAQP